DPHMRILLARNLMSFKLQNRFSQIHLQEMALVMCLDEPNADLRILKRFTEQAIRFYRTFVSNEPPPGEKKGKLRIAIVYFNDEWESELTGPQREELFELAQG